MNHFKNLIKQIFFGLLGLFMLQLISCKEEEFKKEERLFVTTSSLKADFELNGSEILKESYLKGIVIHSMDNTLNTAEKKIYIQDETGGIVIFLENSNISFELGDELVISLEGCTINEVEGGPSIVGTKTSAIENIGKGTLPTPKEITVAELKTGKYYSTLVTLNNVAFDNVNGIKKFTDDTFSPILLNESFERFFYSIDESSDLKGQVVPVGIGSVTGVALVRSPGRSLLIRNLADLSINETIRLSFNIDDTDFGEVESGKFSDTKTYTLNITSGSIKTSIFISNGLEENNLNDSVKIYFSLDGSFFNTFLSIKQDELINNSTEILVKVQTETGLNGEVEQNISLVSFGVRAVLQKITLKEVGN